jgi:hypothetical protein
MGTIGGELRYRGASSQIECKDPVPPSGRVRRYEQDPVVREPFGTQLRSRYREQLLLIATVCIHHEQFVPVLISAIEAAECNL